MDIITSDEIRQTIKTQFKSDRGFFSKKLYESESIKDKSFYTPSPAALQADYKQVVAIVAADFGISPTQVKNLATNPETIWDCDDMAREFRQGYIKLHFKRYLGLEHKINVEPAAFQVTEKSIKNFGQLSFEVIHDFVMIFTTNGIYFADMMKDKVWSINDFKPAIISIGE